GGKTDGGLFLALEVGDNEEKIRELLARRQAQAKEKGSYTDTTEDYNGVALHIVRPARSADENADESAAEATSSGAAHWALHQGRWFIGTKRELVTGALDALAAGGLAESLSS